MDPGLSNPALTRSSSNPIEHQPYLLRGCDGVSRPGLIYGESRILFVLSLSCCFLTAVGQINHVVHQALFRRACDLWFVVLDAEVDTACHQFLFCSNRIDWHVISARCSEQETMSASARFRSIEVPEREMTPTHFPPNPPSSPSHRMVRHQENPNPQRKFPIPSPPNNLIKLILLAQNINKFQNKHNQPLKMMKRMTPPPVLSQAPGRRLRILQRSFNEIFDSRIKPQSRAMLPVPPVTMANRDLHLF